MALIRGFSAESIETRGTTINVLRKGAGRPLLLLHGYPETHLTWHQVAPQLAEQFSVVVPDLRGYGASGKPQGGERHENYLFRAMAMDQVDVMRHPRLLSRQAQSQIRLPDPTHRRVRSQWR